MKFSNLKGWSTPRGNVTKLAIDGVTVWQKVMGTPINTLDVGSSVFMNVGGVRTEFRVVHQGLPSSDYDESCNGTWLLMRYIHEMRIWNDSSGVDYSNSSIHPYLNNTFVNLFDNNVKRVVKQVKLPYTKGAGSGGSVVNGSSGISAKVFLLSYTELGFSGSSVIKSEGATLEYFYGVTDSKRKGYFDGEEANWWIRSIYSNSVGVICYVNTQGKCMATGANNEYGVRPALVLDSSACVDENFNIIA